MTTDDDERHQKKGPSDKLLLLGGKVTTTEGRRTAISDDSIDPCDRFSPSVDLSSLSSLERIPLA
jgi:hypothetical protein